MTAAASAPTRADRRRLVGVCVLLAAAALALWGSTRLTWFFATVPTVARGDVAVAATGSQIDPAPTAVALLALAAVAAAVAVSGIARRVVGLVLIVAAVAAGWATIADATARPTAARLAELSVVTTAPSASPPVVGATAAPLLALLGAVLAVVAGVVLLVREKGMPRLGARYSARPAERRQADPDRVAWEELDAGRDPTVEGPADVEDPRERA